MNYFTASTFKLAQECRTKVGYVNRYTSNKVDNPFLQSLANGAFQVTELARCYHPFGYTINEKNPIEAAKKTLDLLKKKRVVIYNAAFLHNDLFVRIDILIKNSTKTELIEVKSKTVDSSDPTFFANKNEITQEWKEHLFHIAFQRYVASKTLSNQVLDCSLYLIDKSRRASVNGLNQRFYIQRTNNDIKVIKHGKLTQKVLGEKILIKVNVDKFLANLWVGNEKIIEKPFPELVEDIHRDFIRGHATPIISAACATCEYRCGNSATSGFGNCWTTAANFKLADFKEPLTLDLWALNMGNKKSSLIKEKKYFMRDISLTDIAPLTTKKTTGLSSTERRMLQIEKAVTNNTEAYLDVTGLSEEMQKWEYPLHFIDFETTAVAIPFYTGTKPYEQIAFQFSHHLVTKSGIKHANQWINKKVGEFPNFEFIRELKTSLGNIGTIFRYATHENTILNTIYQQLQESDESDKDALCSWIKTITNSVTSSEEKWQGSRTMVDMCELVKKYFYHPLTNGKNSIKSVLEAILHTSEFLQKKYSQPIYGSAIPSKNFLNKIWVVKENETIVNPYKLLPKLFSGIDERYLLSHTDELKDGGAAMSAYAKMQYTKMSDIERTAIEEGLLKYCELDTLAMVMLYEEWINLLN